MTQDDKSKPVAPAASPPRRRWWILAAAVVLAVLAFEVLLPRSLAWVVNRQLVGHATWSHLHVTAHGAVLSNVRVYDSHRQLVLSVPQVRLQYDPGAMLRHGPLAGIRQVVLVHPHLDVSVRADGTLNLRDVYRPPPTPPRALPAFQGLVRLKEGDLLYTDARKGGFATRFASIDGRLDMRGLTGRGRLSFSEPGPLAARFQTDATWRRGLADLRVDIRVDDLDLPTGVNYALAVFSGRVPADLRGHLTRGVAWARLLLTAPGPLAQWRKTAALTGALTVDRLDGDVPRFSVPFRGGKGHFVLASGLIDVQQCSLWLGPDFASAQGHIMSSGSDPQVDLGIYAGTRDVAASLQRLGVTLPVRVAGHGRLSLRLRGPMRRPLVLGTLKSTMARIDGRSFEDVRGRFDYADGVLHLEGLSARAAGGTVAASGWIFVADRRVLIHATTREVRLQELAGALAHGVTGRGSVNLTVLGTQQAPLVFGRGGVADLDLGRQGPTRVAVPSLRGSFLYGEKALLFRNVQASTSLGRFSSPVGFVDLGSRRRGRILVAVRGSGLAYAAGGRAVRGGGGELVVTGTLGKPLAAGRLHVARAAAAGYQVSDVTAALIASSDHLLLSRLDLLWNGMRLEASGGIGRNLADGYVIGVRSPDLSLGRALAALPGHHASALLAGAGRFSALLAGDDRTAWYDTRLAAPGGSLHASGRFSPPHPLTSLGGVATVDGFDARLLDGLGLSALHPAGRLSAFAIYTPRARGMDFFAGGSSRNLTVAGQSFASLQASGRLGRGVVRVDHAEMRGRAGDVAARGTVPTGPGAIALHWRASRLDLGSMVRRLRIGTHPERVLAALKQATLQGLEGFACGTGSVAGTVRAPRVRGTVRVDEALLHRQVLTAQLPFAVDRSRFRVRRGSVQLGGNPLNLDGSVGLPAPTRLHLRVATPRFDLATALGFTPLATAPVRGWLDADLGLYGTVEEATAAGTVGLRDADLYGQPVQSAEVRLQSYHRDLVVRSLQARVGSGAITGSGIMRGDGRLDLALQARHLSLSDVHLKQMGGSGGLGDFTLKVGGTRQQPTADLGFDVHGVRLEGGRVVALRGEAAWASPRLAIPKLQLLEQGASAGASLSGTLDFPDGRLPRSFGELLGIPHPRTAARVDLRAAFSHASLEDFLNLMKRPHAADSGGILNGAIEARGRLPRPRVSGSVAGQQIRLAGVDLGIVDARFVADPEKRVLESLDLRADGPAGRLALKARMNGGEDNHVALSTAGFDLAAMGPFVPWRFPIGGRADSSFDLAGALSEPDLEGSFKVVNGTLSAIHYDSFTGAVSGHEGIYHLNNFLMSVRGHPAKLSGTVPLRLKRGAVLFPAPMELTGSYRGDDLSFLSLFVPDVEKTQGSFNLAFSARGTYPDLLWDADLAIQDGVVTDRRLGVPLENLQVHATVKDHRAQVEHFTGRLGKGSFVVKGGADVAGFSLSNLHLNLTGQELAVVFPPFLASDLDVDLKLTGATPQPDLSGTLTARSASFTLPIGELGRLGSAAGTGAQGGPSSAPAPSASPAAATNFPALAPAAAPMVAKTGRTAPLSLPGLNVSVHVYLGSNAWLKFLGSTIKSEGDFWLVGLVPGDIHPVGRVALTQGQISVPGLPGALRLQPGRAHWNGTTGWIPLLDVHATATVSGYDLYVDVTGPASHPDVAYSSNPPLSRNAIQELLIFGHSSQVPATGLVSTPSSAGAYPSPGAINALVNVAQSSVLSPVTSALRTLFALSDVSFELLNTGGVQLHLAKALDPHGRFFLTYTSLQGTSSLLLPRKVYGFEWRFTPRQLTRLSSDDRGQLHLFYQARWQFW